MTDIRHIRLLNGDELLAKFIGETEIELNLEDPMTITDSTDEANGLGTLALTKYVPYNDSKALVLKKYHVLTNTSVTPEFERYYNTSIAYNDKYVNPGVLREVGRVSRAMENILAAEDKQIKVDGAPIVFIDPGAFVTSNTLH